jgi:hypothetical protein
MEQRPTQLKLQLRAADGSMAIRYLTRDVTMATSFKHLRDFIEKQIRMSHIYQPVMIEELLERRGSANIRGIAAAFLARDESQLEYYEKITKDMPDKVLAKHGIHLCRIPFYMDYCSRSRLRIGQHVRWLRTGCPWEVSLEFAGFGTLSAQCGC